MHTASTPAAHLLVHAFSRAHITAIVLIVPIQSPIIICMCVLSRTVNCSTRTISCCVCLLVVYRACVIYTFRVLISAYLSGTRSSGCKPGPGGPAIWKKSNPGISQCYHLCRSQIFMPKNRTIWEAISGLLIGTSSTRPLADQRVAAYSRTREVVICGDGSAGAAACGWLSM